MENPEEILHSLEEFSKIRPKDIPRELEEYLKFVAKTGDPVYQWSAVKSLFREKLINVITEFYESCSAMEIPPCPNVERFNYDLMKNFILEKLDTFSSAPFTLQRICELLTSPRKEYSRIDKYMRALEKNILVVSTLEPGGRRTENGEGIMNGIDEHVPEPGNEINVEEMDDSPSWPHSLQTNHINEQIPFVDIQNTVESLDSEKISSEVSTPSDKLVCVQYVSIEPMKETDQQETEENKADVSVTITAINIEKVEENDKKESDGEILDSNTDTHSSEVQEKQEIESTLKIASLPEESTVSGSIDEPISDAPTDLMTEEKSIQEQELEPKILTTSEAAPLTSSDEEIPLVEKTDDLNEISVEAEKTEITSPENSVTSSENSPCESNNETSSSTGDYINITAINTIEDKIEKEESFTPKVDLESENSDAVDSTTKEVGASGDLVEESSEVIADLKDEDSTEVASSTLSEPEKEASSTVDNQFLINDDNLNKEIMESDASIIEKEIESSKETEVVSAEDTKLPEESSEIDVIESISQEQATKSEALSTEEKETPMEVDCVSQTTAEIEPNDQQSEPVETTM